MSGTNPVGPKSPASPRVIDYGRRSNDLTTLDAMRNCTTINMAKLFCTAINNGNSTFTGLKPEEIRGKGGLLEILLNWRDNSRLENIKPIVITAIERVENWVPQAQTVPGLGVPVELLGPELRLEDILQQGQPDSAGAPKRTTLTGLGRIDPSAPADKTPDLEQRILDAGRELENVQGELARSIEDRRMDAARIQELEGEVGRMTAELSGTSTNYQAARAEIDGLQAQLQVLRASASAEGEVPAHFIEIALMGLRKQTTTQSQLVAEKRKSLAAALEENQKGLSGLKAFRDLKQTELEKRRDDLRIEKASIEASIQQQEGIKKEIAEQAEQSIKALLAKRADAVGKRKQALKEDYLGKSPALGNIAAALEKYLEIDPRMVSISNIYEAEITEIRQSAQKDTAAADREIVKLKQDLASAEQSASGAESQYLSLDRMLEADIAQRTADIDAILPQLRQLKATAQKIDGILANIDKFDESAANIRKAVEDAALMLEQIIKTING